MKTTLLLLIALVLSYTSTKATFFDDNQMHISNYNISLPNLPAGIYHVNILQNEKLLKNTKLVVMHD